MREEKNIYNKFIIMFLFTTILLTSFVNTSLTYAQKLPNGPYTIQIMNEVKDSEGKFVNGAKYNIYKKYDWNSNGDYTKLKEPKLMNKNPIVVSEHGTEYQLNEPGIYEIIQVERAPGYYAFGTFKENNEDKPLSMIVEFPTMTNGVYDKKQEIAVSPKLDAVIADVGLLKKGEDTKYDNDGLDSVKFKLIQTHDASLSKMSEPKVISSTLQTSAGGFIKMNNLSEGKYELHEIGRSKIDGSIPDKIFADPDGTHLFDTKPIRFTITTNDTGKELLAFTHDENGNKITELEKQEPNSNKLNVDYVVMKKNYRIFDLVKKVEGKDRFHSNIAQPINFSLETKIPTNIEEYKMFNIVDRFDSRLDYIEDSTEIFVDSEKIVSTNFDIKHDNAAKTLSIDFNKNNMGYFKKFAGKTLEIKFQAQLNGAAKKDDSVPNNAKLIFDNGFGVKQETISNTVHVEPQEGSIEIIKVEKGNNDKKLAGAVFSLIDKNTGEIAKDINGVDFRGITDENGQLIFDKVPFGDYYIIEEKAPIGYKLSNEKYDVSLDRDSEYLEYSFIIDNEKDDIDFGDYQDDPKTGSSKLIAMIGLGIAMLFVYIYLKRKENNK